MANRRPPLAVALLSLTDALHVGVCLYSFTGRPVLLACSEVAIETAYCFGMLSVMLTAVLLLIGLFFLAQRWDLWEMYLCRYKTLLLMHFKR